MKTEDQNTGYKESWKDEYLQWICGFANAQGGRIYIGVKDNGNVCGVQNSKKLLEDIPNKINNLLGIVCNVNLLQESGKEYICIEVPAYQAPISYKGVYHYRSGSTKQILTGAALQDFLFKKIGRDWDTSTDTNADINCIDRSAIDYFLRKAIRNGRLSTEFEQSDTQTVLENLDLINEDGKLKNAAILCFGKKPSRYFVGAEFKIGRFGTRQSDLMFQDIVDGNLIQMADKVVEILKSKYLINPIRYEGLLRIEELELPESALREAIFNAIIHRDYTGAATQMRVWNDRIELWNDGELPFGQSIEHLKQSHASKPRNRLLANIFYKAGFIESWGRGIDKICTGFTEQGFAEPVFAHHSGGVLCTIYRKKDNLQDTTQATTQATTQDTTQDLSDLDFRVIKLIENNPSISKREIAEKMGWKIDNAGYYMQKLKTLGIIKRVGNNQKGYWEVIKN